MRIVHVINGLGVGGAEYMLYKVLRAQAGAYEFCRVVSLTDVGPVGARIQDLGIEVTGLGMKRGRPDIRFVARLASIFRDDRPDVVQTWMYHSDLLGGLAGRMVGVPVIWGVRHDCSQGDKVLTRATRRACALLSRWVPAAIVFNSEASRRAHAAAGYSRRKLLVVPNGFDLTRFRPDEDARRQIRQELGVPADTSLVGLIARYHPDKDVENFVIASGMVRDHCPTARFVLCGEGIDAANRPLMRLIGEHRLSHSVSLLGRRDDVERILASLDVSCLSSRTESFPNVIGESMACGVVCVSTECGDVRDIIRDAGRVVPPHDPAALAAGVLEMIRLPPDVRRRLGEVARTRIRASYALDVAAQRFTDIYEAVLARRQLRP